MYFLCKFQCIRGNRLGNGMEYGALEQELLTEHLNKLWSAN